MMFSKRLECSSDQILIHKIDHDDLQLSIADIQSILDDEEYFIWKNYTQKQHKQTEWLRGRIVLKEVVASGLLNQNLTISLRDIHIRQDELCRPHYILNNINDTQFTNISLSHSSRSSIGCFAFRHACVGIDYEFISERNQGQWLERAFHDQELELFPDKSFETLLGYWTAKEAASKANGTGLRDGWRNWQVIQINSPSDLIVCHQNKNFSVKTHKLQDELISVCLRQSECA